MVYSQEEWIDMKDENNDLLKALDRRRRIRQGGLFLSSLLRVLGFGIVSLTGYVFCDFFLSFSQTALIAIDLILLICLVGALFFFTWRILAFSAHDMALHMDHILGSRRHLILSALELHQKSETLPSDLGNFLVLKSIQDGCNQLEKITVWNCFPSDAILKQSKIFFLQCMAAIVLLGAAFSINKVILSRIFFPGRDIPPWSPIIFSTTPAHPKVLYGGTLELAVDISGAKPKSPVVLLTRKADRVNRIACFQEKPSRFTQHLENVVEPMEFCFASGKARSPWQKIEVLLQPQISLAKIEIIPPSYTGLPKREWLAGKEEIIGLAGSRATLFVTSNRPLSEGTLSMFSASGSALPESIKGEKIAAHTISFSWNMKENARLLLDIRDLQGTPTKDKMLLYQKILPDKPPEVALSEPSSLFVLATPHATVPIAAQVSDDLGLKQVRVVRALLGYRDRLSPVGPENVEKSFSFRETVDLKSLGVEEGQVLEFYAEAKDTNPSMIGLGSSEILRIQIISEEEYATMLRSKITLEEFVNRFSLIQNRLRSLLDLLQKIKIEAEKSSRDKAWLNEALKSANSLNKEVEDLFSKMAADFPVYDHEENLRKLLLSTLSLLKNSGNSISKMIPDDATLGSQMDALLKSFGEAEQQFERAEMDAKEASVVGAVMRQATVFKEIIRQQKDLVRRLQRFESRVGVDTDVLQPFSKQQSEIRDDLNHFLNNLTHEAKKLAAFSQYQELHQSTLEFCKQIQELRITPIMDEAATAGKNQDVRKMYQSAMLALEKLESMLSENCSNPEFQGLCNNQIRFEVKKDLAKTLRQMLNSMFSSGSGAGSRGHGGGGVGNPNDGYWANEYSPLNTPAFGPERTRFSKGEDQRGAGKEGRGKHEHTVILNQDSREQRSMDEKRETGGEGFFPERVPEKYRNAVKKYFTH